MLLATQNNSEFECLLVAGLPKAGILAITALQQQPKSAAPKISSTQDQQHPKISSTQDQQQPKSVADGSSIFRTTVFLYLMQFLL